MQKILVFIKEVPDIQEKIKIDPETGAPDEENSPLALNPYDEIALEKAVQLKESDLNLEVVAVNISPETQTDLLHRSMALGADAALSVVTGDVILNSISLAQICSAVILKEKANLALFGNRATDLDNSQTAPRVAGLLDWPQAIYCSNLSLNDRKIVATCETEQGKRDKQMQLPAIVSADLGLAVPRFLRMPELIKARKKDINLYTSEELVTLEDISLTSIQSLSWEIPKERAKTKKLESTADLISNLKNISSGE